MDFKLIWKYILLCGLFFSGCAGLWKKAEPPSGFTAAEIEEIIIRSFPRAIWGIKVVESSEGIFEMNSEKLLIPASTVKLFTTAAALYYLGEDYRVKTPVLISGEVDAGGTLEGSLYIVGMGDPSISHRFHDHPTEVFREWALELKRKGINTIAGDIIGIDTLFKDVEVERTWEWGDLRHYYAVPSNELLLNDNCYILEIIGQNSDPLSQERNLIHPRAEGLIFQQIPRLPKLCFDVDCKIYTEDKRARIGWEWNKPDSMLHITGMLPKGMNKRLFIPACEPTIFFTRSLAATLIEEGIDIVGRARRYNPKTDTVSYEDVDTLLTHESPPLAEIVKTTNTESVNLYAEQLLRLVGLSVYGEASADAGLTALKDFLMEAGIEPGEIHLVDGSGLSRHNWVSPNAVVKLLNYCQNARFSEEWRASLPQYGEGTLEKRISPSSVKTLRAKSGSMGGVRALSGYFIAKNGNEYAFSITCNNYTCSSWEIEDALDAVISMLALP